jgi:hypothetical protein
LDGEQIAGLVSSSASLRPALPAKWPEEAKSLLRACWDVDLAKRPDFNIIALELEKWRSDPNDRVLHALWAGARVPATERALAVVKGKQSQIEPRWPTKAVPPGGELQPGQTTVISGRRASIARSRLTSQETENQQPGII